MQVVGAVGTEDRFHLVALVLAQEAVIDKDAGKPVPDCFRKHDRRDRRIYAAGKRAEHSAVSDFFTDGTDQLAIISRRQIGTPYRLGKQRIP